MSFSDVWSKAVVIHPFNSGEFWGKWQVETGGTCGSWDFLFNEVPQTQENFDLPGLVELDAEKQCLLFLFKQNKIEKNTFKVDRA